MLCVNSMLGRNSYTCSGYGERRISARRIDVSSNCFYSLHERMRSRLSVTNRGWLATFPVAMLPEVRLHL